MAATKGFATPFSVVRLLKKDDMARKIEVVLEVPRKKRRLMTAGEQVIVKRCCSEVTGFSGSGKSTDKYEYWRYDPNNRANYRGRAPATPFAPPRSQFVSKPEKFFSRCTPRNSAPQSHDSPPKRDTGIANEKKWGISLINDNVNESGTNEDGGTWYRESGEHLGENGYHCRWAKMGGQSRDGNSEWKEMWWEKSDWTGYKELGVEKSGRNAERDSWWETWQEVLHQDEWSNLARIERSAQKQAKSGAENARWWEKYDAKGWTEKGAQKYGRLNEQSWWEKWGEHYDGRGSIVKWTDKWAETELGTKWGDKWEDKFLAGIGSRKGETWHASPSGERWSRTWGEEHFGNGVILKTKVKEPHINMYLRLVYNLTSHLLCNIDSKVHKYGKSTTGESWDIVVDEETYYEAEPHYGWPDVVGDSIQLLSIKPRERPPGVFPSFDFRSAPPPA
ncbi:hypothetical protein ACJIZ3_024722 [Penstemon smallii]|uniref:Uncharacterized protein n=1 Tax=Penstemon smallii TaxID=265156 RepID=A0ABD3TTZ5_9LAMI